MKILIYSCLVVLCFGFEDKSATQYLADNGYNTLTLALQKSRLSARLDGNGPFTVFAPTDAAFTAIGFNLSAYTPEQLSTILEHHVISGFILVPMISSPTNRTTLENQTLTLDKDGVTILINGNTRVDNSNNDIIVNNGVIQPIDKVLLPPVIVTYNIYQVLLKEDDKFRDLSLALFLAGLDNVIQGSEYTFFAPTNAAFAVYQDNLLNPSAPNAKAVYQGKYEITEEVFKYHMVPGARFSSQLTNGRIYTLHGTPLNVTVGAGVMINNANVIEADIRASNGVIHAVDKVLIPQDIYQIAGRK